MDIVEVTTLNYLAKIIAVMFISAIISAMSVYIYHNKYDDKIISADFSNYITKQEKLYLQQKISKKAFTKRLTDVSKFILSLPKNYIIVDSKAFLKVKNKIKLEDYIGNQN